MAVDKSSAAYQLAGPAKDAGFEGMDLLQIIRIAIAESGGNWNAVNNTAFPDRPGYREPQAGFSPEYSVGALQINLLAHPDVTEDQARDPAFAFRYAYHLAKETPPGFSHWTTYDGRAPLMEYDRNLAEQVSPQSFAGSRSPDPVSFTNPLDALNKLFDPKVWAKIGVNILAVLLIIGGFILYAFGPAIKTTATVAAKAA